MGGVRRLFCACSVAATLAFGVTVVHPAAQTRPADASGQCKDGTYTTAKTKRGACAGHGGVTTWFADQKSDTKAAAKASKADAKAAAADSKAAAKSAAADTKGAAKSAGAATKDAAKSAASGTKAAAKTVAKPAGAPEDATARCKDGTFSQAKQHRGACSGHGGVAEWYK